MSKQIHHGKKSTGSESLVKVAHINRLILENAHDMVTINRLSDLGYEYVNPATVKVLGYAVSELLTMSALDLVHPDDRERVLSKIDENLPAGKGHDELRFLTKQGSYLWLEVSGTLLPQEDMEILVMFIARDITERRQMEDQATVQLKSCEERFSTLFAEAPVGISINRKGRILFANQAYSNMLGFADPGELIGTMTTDQVAPSCRKKIAGKIKRREKGKEATTSHESLGLRRDGSIFPIFVQVDSIDLEDGPANVAFITDISARKKSEAALRHQVEAQRILLEISKQFANIITYNIDAMINLALQQIGEFHQCDRSYLFMLSSDGRTASNTHEWCAEGINPEINNLQSIPVSKFPWWMDQLYRHESICIPQVKDLPPAASAEKALLEPQGIQSALIMPIVTDDQLMGFIGFDSVNRERQWSSDNIVILESVAQIIAKGLQRKNYAEALERSENHYRAIFENTGAATMIIEADLAISLANQQSGMLLGQDPAELAGKKLTDFLPGENAAAIAEDQSVVRSGPLQYETQLIDKNGTGKEGVLKIDAIPGSSQAVVTFVDLSELKRIDRALRAISAVNVAIVQTDNEEALLEKVCQNIVAIGGYSLAWVAYLQDTPDLKVKQAADAGRNFGYTNKLNISLKDPTRNKGPVGRALWSGRPVVCRNIKTDPDFKPWAKDALRRGFKACMAIPLLADNQAYGALALYSDNLGVFDKEEEKLLIEMANNLAFAVNSLRTKNKLFGQT